MEDLYTTLRNFYSFRRISRSQHQSYILRSKILFDNDRKEEYTIHSKFYSFKFKLFKNSKTEHDGKFPYTIV